MKKFLLLINFLMTSMFITSTYAEEYSTAVGIRLGSLYSGVNLKTFVSSNGALEGIVGFGHHSFVITALYEKHHNFTSAEGLSWYVGAGAHVGFFDDQGTYWRYKNRGEKYYLYRNKRNATIPGVDIIIGLEWKIPGAPLLLGVDLKPQVDFYHGARSYFDAAINIRYIL